MMLNALGCGKNLDTGVDSTESNATADDTSVDDCPNLTTAELYDLYDQDADGYLAETTPDCILEKIINNQIAVDDEVYAHVLADEWDADDQDATIYPGAPELCDGLDNNQDGEVDEDPTDGVEYFRDADDDGYGDAVDLQKACEQPLGYVEDQNDCDDADAATHPDAVEVCGDGKNNDCSLEPSTECRVGDLNLEDAQALVVGSTANRQIGEAIASSGDLDGDGFHDLVIGVPQSGVTSDYGYVLLYSGQPDLSAMTLDRVVLQGSTFGDATGFSVAFAGDVNGDGDGDLWVSARETGVVELVYGPMTSGVIGSIPGHAITNTSSTDYFGTTVVPLQNSESESSPAVLVGATEANVGGTVYLFANPNVASTEADADAEFVGQTSEGLGKNAAVADFDGDGILDLALGASDAQGAVAQSGSVYVFYDANRSGVISTSDADVKLLGELTDARFGISVAAGVGQDYDGDGVDDLLVGESWNSQNQSKNGAAYVFVAPLSDNTPASMAYASVKAESQDQQLGHSVAFAKLDSESSDLFLGSPFISDIFATGAVWQVYAVQSGVLSEPNVRWLGFDSGDRTGNVVVNLGDVTGDGRDEVAVGSNYSDRTATHGGVVSVVESFGE